MDYQVLESPATRHSDNKTRLMSQISLAFGSFAIGTAEFVSMGLLPEMATATNVSIPVAGHYIATYALGVVIGAPILAVTTARMSRKFLLILLMLCYAVFNIASSFATNYETLVLLRFISGLPHGLFFGVAAIAVSSMVPVKERSKAIGNVMLGLTIATVIGAPAATLIGQMSSWSVAFILVGFIALLSVAMVIKYLPQDMNFATSAPLSELSALKSKQVWLMLAVVSIGSGGLFAVFTYIKSILMVEAGFSINQVPFIMPLLGCGMVVGNIVGPRLAEKFGLMWTISVSMFVGCLFYVVFYLLCGAQIGAAIGCFLVGTSFAGMPSIQTRIMDVAQNAQTLAGALVQSAFNVANAIGARAGGFILIMGYSYADTALLGACLTFAGFLIFLFSWYLDRRDKQHA